MKVLVTGATGFIGCEVVRALARAGADVHALVRPDSPREGRLQGVKLSRISGDVTRLEQVKDELSRLRPDLCVHLAWYVVPGEYLTSNKNLDMLAASTRLAECMADVGCKTFVGVGTNFEYDATTGYVSEESPLRPQSLYAASKVGLYHVLEALSAQRGFRHAWARIFYQYGPREDERRLVPAVILPQLRGEESRLTAGEQVRDFLHVEDVGEAIAQIALSDVRGAVNVGSGVPIRVRDLAKTIAELCGGRGKLALGALPYRSGDPMFVCANTDKLRKSTAFKPRYDLRDGLAHTIAWWQKATEAAP